ncbi:tRNA (guanosine(46)-N7)-methyltransferase TrmB [Polynucleobacter rarus]|uniref:tRNA (guanosine(46)-N7)-methyltransferase TrmB n=1 Tax=Polynucleobacter rarus TaxID=556055 RepID=UPI000D3E0513|nr:tRNA (guanosine(46)-N7)-methyltransferase TrmB [Polynucleobacter rarus]
MTIVKTEELSTPSIESTDQDSVSTSAVSLWPRRIKSFVMRAGRTTSGQQKAIDELGPQFLIPFSKEPLQLQAAFGDSSKNHILEIGFGMGETTAHIAKIRPNDHFLAIEVHEPGVGALLKQIGELSLQNIRIIRHDAVEVVEYMLADNSLDGFHLFFPDPWHKKKHNKRRLVQPDFLEKILPKLKSGAYIHMATDWEEYAFQMLDVLTQHPQIKNTSTNTVKLEDGREVLGFAIRPDYRPITKFENRGLKLGHGVWDLMFIKL